MSTTPVIRPLDTSAAATQPSVVSQAQAQAQAAGSGVDEVTGLASSRPMSLQAYSDRPIAVRAQISVPSLEDRIRELNAKFDRENTDRQAEITRLGHEIDVRNRNFSRERDEINGKVRGFEQQISQLNTDRERAMQALRDRRAGLIQQQEEASAQCQEEELVLKNKIVEHSVVLQRTRDVFEAQVREIQTRATRSSGRWSPLVATISEREDEREEARRASWDNYKDEERAYEMDRARYFESAREGERLQSRQAELTPVQTPAAKTLAALEKDMRRNPAVGPALANLHECEAQLPPALFAADAKVRRLRSQTAMLASVSRSAAAYTKHNAERTRLKSALAAAVRAQRAVEPIGTPLIRQRIDGAEQTIRIHADRDLFRKWKLAREAVRREMEADPAPMARGASASGAGAASDTRDEAARIRVRLATLNPEITAMAHELHNRYTGLQALKNRIPRGAAATAESDESGAPADTTREVVEERIAQLRARYMTDTEGERQQLTKAQKDLEKYNSDLDEDHAPDEGFTLWNKATLALEAIDADLVSQSVEHPTVAGIRRERSELLARLEVFQTQHNEIVRGLAIRRDNLISVSREANAAHRENIIRMEGELRDARNALEHIEALRQGQRDSVAGFRDRSHEEVQTRESGRVQVVDERAAGSVDNSRSPVPVPSVAAPVLMPTSASQVVAHIQRLGWSWALGQKIGRGLIQLGLVPGQAPVVLGVPTVSHRTAGSIMRFQWLSSAASERRESLGGPALLPSIPVVAATQIQARPALTLPVPQDQPSYYASLARIAAGTPLTGTPHFSRSTTTSSGLQGLPYDANPRQASALSMNFEHLRLVEAARERRVRASLLSHGDRRQATVASTDFANTSARNTTTSSLQGSPRGTYLSPQAPAFLAASVRGEPLMSLDRGASERLGRSVPAHAVSNPQHDMLRKLKRSLEHAILATDTDVERTNKAWRVFESYRDLSYNIKLKIFAKLSNETERRAAQDYCDQYLGKDMDLLYKAIDAQLPKT